MDGMAFVPIVGGLLGNGRRTAMGGILSMLVGVLLLVI